MPDSSNLNRINLCHKKKKKSIFDFMLVTRFTTCATVAGHWVALITGEH